MPLPPLCGPMALITIDLEPVIAELEGIPLSIDEVVEQAALLATAFRARNWPVVLTTVHGSLDQGHTDIELGPARVPDNMAVPDPRLVNPDNPDRDIRINKYSWSAFDPQAPNGTSELMNKLRGLGINRVVIVGAATNVGILATVRDARQRHGLTGFQGFDVIVPEDAITNLVLVDPTGANHQAAVDIWLPALAHMTTVNELLAAMDVSDPVPTP